MVELIKENKIARSWFVSTYNFHRTCFSTSASDNAIFVSFTRESVSGSLVCRPCHFPHTGHVIYGSLLGGGVTVLPRDGREGIPTN